tara:strand:+ start:12574 stop:12993 length:420 start_codon:yes stop_codon:yes gene_type:complete
MAKTLTDPLEALQRAQYATLSGDAALQAISSNGVKVFDRVSEDSFPFCVIGEDREEPDDNCETWTEIFSTVRVYSRVVGKLEAKRIAGRTRYLLDVSNGFTLTGFKLRAGHCTGIKIHNHEDKLTTQAELNFRYLVQPA